MPLETILKNAVRSAIGDILAQEIQDIVAKETRRALRDHEDKLTNLVRTAVTEAIEELLQ